uniref:Myb-like domain-containing protein n=1 Tax=Plectus sambesii TaxID=2011161 RepID=A0A914VBP7_9BILA
MSLRQRKSSPATKTDTTKKRTKKDTPDKDEQDPPFQKPHPRLRRILPPTGLIDLDGCLFYHRTTNSMTGIFWERLLQCGVHITMGQFSAKEDRRLRKNWRRFAREHQIPHEDAYRYIGIQNSLVPAEERNMIRRFRDETLFWPRMCRKLDDRTAKQIHHRLATLFHPAKMERGEAKKWTEEEDEQLAYLYSIHGPSWVRIGSILGRPEKHCEIRYRDHHSHFPQTGTFTLEERRKFIDVMTAALGEKTLLSAAKRTDYATTVDWNSVSEQMGRRPLSCVRRWGTERKLFFMQLEREMAICSSDITAEEVAQELPLVEKRMHISPTDTLEVIIKVRQQNPEKHQDIDFERVAADCAHLGKGLDSVQYCRRVYHRFINISPRLPSRETNLSEYLDEIIRAKSVPKTRTNESQKTKESKRKQAVKGDDDAEETNEDEPTTDDPPASKKKRQK